jgi:hypothetical protein
MLMEQYRELKQVLQTMMLLLLKLGDMVKLLLTTYGLMVYHLIMQYQFGMVIKNVLKNTLIQLIQ